MKTKDTVLLGELAPGQVFEDTQGAKWLVCDCSQVEVFHEGRSTRETGERVVVNVATGLVDVIVPAVRGRRLMDVFAEESGDA